MIFLNPLCFIPIYQTKSISLIDFHDVCIDIFVFRVGQARFESLKRDIYHVRNYFEVTTLDHSFLWGETLSDELSTDNFLTIIDYKTIFDNIQKKPSMLHRKMDWLLKAKALTNSSIKI